MSATDVRSLASPGRLRGWSTQNQCYCGEARRSVESPQINSTQGQLAVYRDTARKRRRLFPALALLVGITLATAGCNTVPVTSSAGVLTATSGSNTTLTWFFFNQDFKDFAASRTVPGFPATATAVYPTAVAAEPGSKFFKVEQVIDSSSTTSGSGAATQVLLKANEFANQGDGLTLSASEDLTLVPPAYGFSWLTGGASTQVTTVVPSDLCGLFVLVLWDTATAESSGFYSDVVATTDTYSCSGGTQITSQGERAVPPGIFLSVNAVLLGRKVEGSPVYYGAERIAVASTFLLTVTAVSRVTPSVVTLAQGIIDADGSFSSMSRLPLIPSGTYNVRMTGLDTDGNTLELTSQVTVGDEVFTSIGANIPTIR